jgi:hypothetical protein
VPLEASNRRNSAQSRPLSDQQLTDIDQSLLNGVDGARKALYDYRIALGDVIQRCSGWEQAYYEESQKRIACAGAYAELYDKHDKTVNNLHAMSSQCLSLHRDLEHAQTDILALESTIQEQEQSSDGKDTPDTGEGSGPSHLDWHMVDKIEQLEARIKELENENFKMMQEHEKAMIDAADQISIVKREADLAKMCQTPPRKVRSSASRKVGKACNDDEAGPQQQGGRGKRSRKQEVKPEPCSP